MMDAEALVGVVDDDASLRKSLQNLLWSVGLRGWVNLLYLR
jgi:FixJ family two-component response regulator